MSHVGDAFVAGLGRPDPVAPCGVRFEDDVMQSIWDGLHREVGAGWYLNRYLYLFGEGLDALTACLEAWPFVVPPNHPDRVILGRNAYGAIIVLEDANIGDGTGEVCILDPTRVEYWRSSDIGFVNLLGNWLPERDLPNFFETDVYDLWVGATDEYLGEDVILAMEVPFGLGGAWQYENFNEEHIVEYYESMAPIYAQAFEKMGRS